MSSDRSTMSLADKWLVHDGSISIPVEFSSYTKSSLGTFDFSYLASQPSYVEASLCASLIFENQIFAST